LKERVANNTLFSTALEKSILCFRHIAKVFFPVVEFISILTLTTTFGTPYVLGRNKWMHFHKMEKAITF